MIPTINISELDPSKIFLIGDTHFNHFNIIKYCNRPFKTAEEMNEHIITKWNETVSDGDLVLVMGDFVFSKAEKDSEYFKNKLNGNLLFFKGNHDYKFKIDNETFYKEAKLVYGPNASKDYLFLSHYPVEEIKNPLRWSIHAHSHNKGELINYNTKKVCVSAELLNYIPITLKQILNRISKI